MRRTRPRGSVGEFVCRPLDHQGISGRDLGDRVMTIGGVTAIVVGACGCAVFLVPVAILIADAVEQFHDKEHRADRDRGARGDRFRHEFHDRRGASRPSDSDACEGPRSGWGRIAADLVIIALYAGLAVALLSSLGPPAD
ncbi:hypothetical protein [Nocardia sp. NPDC051570]|uniref:hypothetical protein n=1 Tax=Nocardia sp. NPDC051570 TaxID=3364324 RepID=UPI0037A73406